VDAIGWQTGFDIQAYRRYPLPMFCLFSALSICRSFPWQIGLTAARNLPQASRLRT
jgi:hypothetical protein